MFFVNYLSISVIPDSLVQICYFFAKTLNGFHHYGVFKNVQFFNNSNPFNGLLSRTTHGWAPLHPD